MAGAPKLTPEGNTAGKSNVHSHASAQAMKEEHEVYRRTLLRHMTLHRAWESNAFSAEMHALYDKTQAELPPHKAQSPEHVTAAMVELAFVDPEEHFPEVAAQVREDARRQDPTGLLELLDHDKNAKLAALSEGGKKDLLNIANDMLVRETLQYDLLHERVFGVSSTQEGGSLRQRIEAWIDRGLANNLAGPVHKASKYTAPFAGLASGPMALAGMGVILAAQKTAPFLAKLTKEGLKAAKEHVSGRMSLNAERIIQLTQSLDALSKGKRRQTTITAGASLAMAGAMGALGYASHHAPGLGESIIDIYQALSSIDLSIWEVGNAGDSATAEASQEGGKDSYLEKARAAQSFLVGSILTGISTYLKSQSRINVEEAGTFFKEQALNMGTPTIDTQAVDDIGRNLAQEPPLWADHEDTQEDWRQHLAEQPEQLDYSQAMSLLREALDRIEASPRQASTILESMAPMLPDLCERIAKSHEALIDQEGLGRLARENKAATHAILEMATADDVMTTFMEAAGQRQTPEGDWEQDDRLGAGRHRGKVARQISDAARLTAGALPPEQLSPKQEPQEPERQPEGATVVTPPRRSTPFAPGA